MAAFSAPVRSLFSLVLNAVVAFMLGWFIYENFNELKSHSLHLNYGLLVLAVISMMISYVLLVRVWMLLTESMGLVAPFWQGVYAWVKGQLGKYVPGKVTILLLRLEVYRGHSRKKVVVATMIEMLLTMIASALVILFAVTLTPGLFPSYVWQSAILLLLVLALSLWPPLLFGVVNRILSSFGRDVIEQFPDYTTLWRYVVGYIGVSILQGLAFYLVLRSMTPVDMQHIFIIIGIYELASLIGILALFAPGGLGVREGALFIMLPLLISTGAAVVSAVLIRIISVLVEVLLVAIAGSMKSRYVI